MAIHFVDTCILESRKGHVFTISYVFTLNPSDVKCVIIGIVVLNANLLFISYRFLLYIYMLVLPDLHLVFFICCCVVPSHINSVVLLDEDSTSFQLIYQHKKVC